MKVRRRSSYYNFIGDTESGITFRWGRIFEENPAYAPWPELADISISNHCAKGCKFCYRDSTVNYSFMSLKDYEIILNELNHPKWGNVFQVALGGGEPFEHPKLGEIIDLTISYGVIPNLTTNGLHINTKWADFLEERIGAIAISVDDIDKVDFEKILLLASRSIRTNIHYLLNKSNIIQAVQILKGAYDTQLSRLNSIIFLTHKPFGRATVSDTLAYDEDLKVFIRLIDDKKTSTRIGFDACFVPILLHLTNTNADYVDSCECGFFSVYLDEKMNVTPCSFAKGNAHTFSLKEISFKDIWEYKFQAYRNIMINKCVRNCRNKRHCRGPCVYYDEINYCYSTDHEDALHV